MWHEQLMHVQVSSAMLFDMVAAGEEFQITDVQWRHTSDSASERQRLFTMVFRWGIVPTKSRACPPCLTSQFPCQSEVLCAETASRGVGTPQACSAVQALRNCEQHAWGPCRAHGGRGCNRQQPVLLCGHPRGAAAFTQPGLQLPVPGYHHGPCAGHALHRPGAGAPAGQGAPP